MVADRLEKLCPGCEQVLPREAFRKDKGKPDGMDSYCKKCRRAQTVANRPRENARWRNHRKTKGVKPKSKLKVNARAQALKAFPDPEQCHIKRCANRAERHHYKGYEPNVAKDIMWLCREHHAQQHILERARARTGPSYF